MRSPIYVRIHRYNKDQHHDDAYTLAALHDTGDGYERMAVHGPENLDQINRTMEYAGADMNGVPLDSVLVSDEVRNTIISTVVPIEWKAALKAGSEVYLTRIRVFFHEGTDWQKAEETRDHGPASHLFDFVFDMAQHGGSFDTSPTMNFDCTSREMYGQFVTYLRSIQASIKSGAQMSIDAYERARKS